MISATTDYVHSDIHSTVARHLGGGRWAVSDMPGYVVDGEAALRHIMWRELEKGRQLPEKLTPDQARTHVQALLAEARAVLTVVGAGDDRWLEARMEEANYLLCLTQLVLGRLPGEQGASCMVCHRSDKPLRQVGVSATAGLVFACKGTCLGAVMWIRP